MRGKRLIFLFIFFFFPFLTLGAGLVPCEGRNEPPCEICYFFVLIKNVIDFLLFKIIPILIPFY